MNKNAKEGILFSDKNEFKNLNKDLTSVIPLDPDLKNAITTISPTPELDLP